MAGTPAGATGTPDAVAHAAVYLASDEAAFVHGTVLDVDGAGSRWRSSRPADPCAAGRDEGAAVLGPPLICGRGTQRMLVREMVNGTRSGCRPLAPMLTLATPAVLPSMVRSTVSSVARWAVKATPSRRPWLLKAKPRTC